MDFNLQKSLSGAKTFTKDGRKVTNIRIVNPTAPKSPFEVNESKGEQYIQGLLVTIHNSNFEADYPYYHNGGSHLYGLKTLADLITVD